MLHGLLFLGFVLLTEPDGHQACVSAVLKDPCLKEVDLGMCCLTRQKVSASVLTGVLRRRVCAACVVLMVPPHHGLCDSTLCLLCLLLPQGMSKY